jgi:hypothetical protein
VNRFEQRSEPLLTVESELALTVDGAGPKVPPLARALAFAFAVAAWHGTVGFLPPPDGTTNVP